MTLQTYANKQRPTKPFYVGRASPQSYVEDILRIAKGRGFRELEIVGEDVSKTFDIALMLMKRLPPGYNIGDYVFDSYHGNSELPHLTRTVEGKNLVVMSLKKNGN